MEKISIGIDPGKSGFITIFNGNDAPLFIAMPLVKKQIDLSHLAVIFYELKTTNRIMHCVLEDVHAMFGSAAKATFNFGYICGVLEALLVANRIPYTKVAPKKWQKQMWEGIPLIKKPSTSGKTQVTDTKAMSLLAAKRLFPDVDLRATERSTIPHDGKIDSLLIAEYCRRNF